MSGRRTVAPDGSLLVADDTAERFIASAIANAVMDRLAAWRYP
jgi:hypothetical protein